MPRCGAYSSSLKGGELQLEAFKDVAFYEEASRVCKDHAPENLVLIRYVGLNLLRQDISAKDGIKAKRFKDGGSNDDLSH